MLVHRTPSRVSFPPRADTALVEPAETLQPRHGHTHFKFLQADGALGRVNAVLLCRSVGEHACSSRHYWWQWCPTAAVAPFTCIRQYNAAVCAVGCDAYANVRLAQSLKIGKRA